MGEDEDEQQVTDDDGEGWAVIALNNQQIRRQQRLGSRRLKTSRKQKNDIATWQARLSRLDSDIRRTYVPLIY